MVCSSHSRRGGHIFWRSLFGVTFLFCCLLVYHFLIYDNISCSTQSGCSKSLKTTTEKLRSKECNSVCNTKECIYISDYISTYIDESVDPCHDFYEFACGKLIDKYQTHENYSTLFNRQAQEFYITVKDTIESSKEPYGTAMNKLKIVYDSCMRTGSSELRVTQSLLSFLGHLGVRNWPHLSPDFSFGNSLPEMLGRLNLYKQDIFYYFAAFHDDNSSSENPEGLQNLRVYPAHSSYDEDDLKELERIITRILRRMGLDLKTVETIWNDFFTVETKLIRLQEEIYDIDNTCDDTVSIKCQVEEEESMIMVCKIIEAFVRNGRLSSQFTNDQLSLRCWILRYIEGTYGVIKNCSDRVIANYIVINLLSNNRKYMDFFSRKTLTEYSFMTQHYEMIEPDKWKYCVSWIAENMPIPLGAVYADKMISEETADKVNDMVQELHDLIIDFVLRQKWIGESAKKEAIKELKEEENIFSTIFQGMKNKTKINSWYKRFNPTRTSFLRNVWMNNKILIYLSLMHKKEMQHFSEGFNPFLVNAYGGGYIYLTFGILAPPNFHHRFPNLFNIAKIGQITGHEIGHTLYFFLESSTHVDNATKDIFKEKQDCLVDQYFNFEQKRIKKYVQGNMTLSENFPDNMSLKMMEKISQKYLRNMTKSGFTLPGLNYSPEELFYISYAQTWCEVGSVERELYYHENDHHTVSEFRIKGALQNSMRFSEVFNCSKTSFMNPQKKCVIFE